MRHMVFLSIWLCIKLLGQDNEYRVIKDVEGFKTKMIAANKTYSTLQADFTQEKYLSFMTQKIYSNGQLKFKISDMMKLEYFKPTSYIISFFKSKVYIKDNGKITKYDAKSNKVFKFINQTMIDAVQGNVFNNKDYNIKYFENKEQVLLELEPISNIYKDYISQIKIYVSKKDFTVNQLLMTEKSGDYTLMSFSKKKTNEPIPDAEFEIK